MSHEYEKDATGSTIPTYEKTAGYDEPRQEVLSADRNVYDAEAQQQPQMIVDGPSESSY